MQVLKKLLPQVVMFVLLIASSPVIVLGQAGSPTTRNALLEQIKVDAARHVGAGSPMQTQLIVDLYGNNAVGVTRLEIAQTYENEYIKQKKALEPGPFDKLRPNLAWIVAVILALALIFYKVLEKWISALIETVGGRLWNKLASNRFFKSVALQRYQKALSEKYSDLRIPFSNRPLKMREIYVPLKVAGSTSTEQLDALQAIRGDRRLMIVGPPGSGKSMLLKNLAFNYGQGNFTSLPDQPVPILLELHYLSEKPDLTLTEHLSMALARNSFSQAERFVSQNLTKGTLMLLLDGLDEVNSTERARVVSKIRDFLDEHRECRTIITCRNAVYKGEFADSVDRTLEIVEFSDQQVRSFLSSWEPYMPAGRSVEQLMHTLRDRPRIMALARNPLLLTIIAYLYTDTPYVLPHSRAEFYRQSTDVLLRQWHQERNVYESRDKQAILQRLALYFMDSSAERQQDPRSLDFQTVLEQVKLLLPKLNLRQDQDVRPLLNEIVERSGLLLSIDGGQQYQFAHLTLQEYFAAEELSDDSSGLIKRFLKDHDSWRETVKLWCGLGLDSTSLISSVYEADPVTAFECLADAKIVDQILSDRILNLFYKRLGDGEADADSISRAFGAVAADLRPRGAAVFAFLKNTLATSQNPSERNAAATALSLTNLPEAAKTLADRYASSAEIRAALCRMGDLAVPALEQLAEAGDVTAVRELEIIGTPQAAEALTGLLFHVNNEISTGSAWGVASLLVQPTVEDALRRYQLKELQRFSPRLDYVWKPFSEPPGSSLPIIAGRVAFLLNNFPLQDGPQQPRKLDPRLVLPLCCVEGHRDLHEAVEQAEISSAAIDIIRRVLPIDVSPDERFPRSFLVQALKDFRHQDAADSESARLLINTILASPGMSERLRYFLSSMPATIQARVLGDRFLIYPSRVATTADWTNLFARLDYNVETGWHYRVITVFALSASAFALVEIFLGRRSFASQLFALAAFGLPLFFAPRTLLWEGSTRYEIWGRKPDELLKFGLFGFFMAPIYVISNIKYVFGPYAYSRSNELKEMLEILACGAWLPIVVYFTTPRLLSFVPWYVVVAAWVFLLGICAWLALKGSRLDNEARNPLRGILDSPTAVE